MASGSKDTVKTKQHSVQTPNVPGWIGSPYQDFMGKVSALGQLDPASFTTPATANQNLAFARAGAGTGDPTWGGYNATQDLLGYTPSNVSAGQLSQTDLAPYMDPYERSVIDATLADFGNANALGLNQLRASTPTGAFNGSRQGVAEGQLTSDNLRTLAGTIAGLRSANFGQARQGAMFDIGNRFAGDQFNVNSGLQGANFRLGAANQLANIGMMGANNTRADTQMMADLGNTERGINSEINPNVARLSLLQAIGGLMGQVPSALFTGQTTDQSGTQTSRHSPGLFEGLGTIANIASMFMGNPFKVSDRRLKRDIERIGERGGLPWYRFSYVWDGPGVRHEGVMADEAPAHAVHWHPAGFAMVDYAALGLA